MAHSFPRESLPRGLALFFALFALTNLLGSLKASTFDANLWWIDLRWLPGWIANSFLALAAIVFMSFGLGGAKCPLRRALTLFFSGALSLACFANAINVVILLVGRKVSSSVPLPLSLLIVAAMFLIFVSAWTATSSNARPGTWSAVAVRVCCAIVFPLTAMFCFGKTDYRRPADVAVVLGCRVYADGRPSDALKDRVRTACQLYRDGFTRKLLFSGGPGDGPISESQAMRTMALQLGVEAEDILVDDKGFNTQATVRNSEAIFSKLHASRVLVVSHFYHLPRLKLAYQRAGQEVFTVPAKESYLLRQMPYNMAREVAALWVYYIRPLATTS